MRKLLIILILASITYARSQEETSQLDTPFFLPCPEGWLQEAFPLSRYHENLSGIEDLRFAPGFFEKGTEDMWSYLFVWWIDNGAEISPATLEADLEHKFRVVMKSVLASSNSQAENPVYAVSIDSSTSGPFWKGTVETYDAFVMHENIKTNLRVSVRECNPHKAVFIEMSPQSSNHEIWTWFDKIRQGFRCEK